MLAIVGAVTGLKTFKGKKDDDKIDRLSNRYTVVLLISFTFVVMLRVAVSSSIICWTDKHFTKGWVTYTNNYCWVKNTYYLPFDEEIPREDEPKDYIPYYQWIPFILLGQALGFYFPSVVWHSWNCVAGVDADTVLTAAQSFNKLQDEEKRTTTLRRIRIQMDRFLINKKQALSSKEMQTLTLRERIRRRRFFELSSRRFVASHKFTFGGGSHGVLLY